MITGKVLMINAYGALLLMAIGISLAAGSQETYTEARSVSRLNYGMKFKFRGHFERVTQTWRHTFGINLPTHEFDAEFDFNKTDDSKVLAQCVESLNLKDFGGKREHGTFHINPGTTCGKYSANIILLMNLAKNGHKKIRTLVDDIRGLIEQEPTLKGGGKRAPLEFMGDFMAYAFGVGKAQDIHQLGTHVKEMQGVVNSQLKIMKTTTAHLNSFILTQNARLDNLVKTVKILAVENLQLVEDIKWDVGDIFLKNLQYVNTKNVRTLQLKIAQDNLVSYYSNFLNALEVLMAGRLPTFLIGPEILSHALSEVAREVEEEGLNFRVVHKAHQWYYQKAVLVFARHEDRVYVTMQIPLTSFATKFRAFRLQILPVTLPEEPNHIMMIDDLPAAWSISDASA